MLAPPLALLVGGAGRRLGGVAKGLLVIDGVAIIRRQLDAARQAGLRPLLVGGQLERYDAVVDAEVERVADLRPGQGPLAGIEAALAHTGAEHVVVLACDLPYVTAATLRALASAPAEAPLVVSCAGVATQPLLARYAQKLLPDIGERLAAGRRRVGDLIAAHPPLFVEVAAAELANVNTAEELAALGGAPGPVL